MNPIRNESRGASRVALAVSGDAELLQDAHTAFEAVALQVLALETAAETPLRAKARQPFLVLLDLERADTLIVDGTRLLEALKTSPYTSTVPVIVVLPYSTSEEVQLSVFQRGADECLVRTGSPELFQARLQAMAKRHSAPEDLADTVFIDGLSLDLRARKVLVNGQTVALTRKEFDLLNMLLRRRSLVVYTTHLYHSVWGYGESSPVDSHTVKVHISSLRSKLGAEFGKKIVNLPGLGYRFDT